MATALALGFGIAATAFFVRDPPLQQTPVVVA